MINLEIFRGMSPSGFLRIYNQLKQYPYDQDTVNIFFNELIDYIHGHDRLTKISIAVQAKKELDVVAERMATRSLYLANLSFIDFCKKIEEFKNIIIIFLYRTFVKHFR